ncbi:MAG: hypothetical protein P1U65_03690 [Minwuia sp.]|nr:hypothetical protein [Minwuia sp.]
MESQKQILEAAGQRNASAIQYHFGSREGLLRAVFEQGVARINMRRNEILDMYEARNRPLVLKDYITALVLPLCEQRLEGETGNQTLRFLNQVLSDPNIRLIEIMKGIDSGMRRGHLGVVKCLPEIPPLLLRFRLYAATRMISGVLCDWDRNRKLEQYSEAFLDDMLGMVVATVSHPPSEKSLEGLSEVSAGDRAKMGYTNPVENPTT